MSIVAMNWAMKQRTDGPSAQIVLFTIADRANEHGVCRHADPDTISELTRQSRATVFRRLEELERAGTLARFTRHLDDGRREYEIRLQLGTEVNYKTNKERDIIHCDEDGAPITVVPYGGEPQPDEPQSQSETHDGSQIETESVAPVRPGESQSCDPQKSPSKSPEDNPLPPKGGGGCQDSQELQGSDDPSWAHAASWARIEQFWGDPILHQRQCRQLWSALSEAERERFIRVVRGYLAWRLKQQRPPNRCNIQKLMRERDAWPGYEKLAGPDPALRAFVVENSVEHRALQAIARVVNLPLRPMTFDQEQGQRGYWRPCALRADEIAMAQFADKPLREWTLLERNTKPFFAWSSRMHEWTGARYDEMRVPCLWPPRKDGTISPTQEDATGPPE